MRWLELRRKRFRSLRLSLGRASLCCCVSDTSDKPPPKFPGVMFPKHSIRPSQSTVVEQSKSEHSRSCLEQTIQVLLDFVQTAVIKKKLVLRILLLWDLRDAFVWNAVSFPQLRSPAFALRQDLVLVELDSMQMQRLRVLALATSNVNLHLCTQQFHFV